MTDLDTFGQVSLDFLAFMVGEFERLNGVFTLFNDGIVLPRRD